MKIQSETFCPCIGFISDKYRVSQELLKMENATLLISFRVFWKALCRNEILVFLWSAHFPYRDRVKMRSFQEVFSEICIF